MLKKLVLALAFSLLPAVAVAQDHHAHGAAAKQSHAHMKKPHQPISQMLMERRAELALTEEQIAKLETFSVKMTAHHKLMAAGKAKHDAKSEEKMHEELFAIFTPEQLAKVKPLMQKYQEMCAQAEGQEAHCKLDGANKKKMDIQ